MASSPERQSDAQHRPLHPPDRANGSPISERIIAPDNIAHQLERPVESTPAAEMELSHYLHYEDNACFFAPSWLDHRRGARIQGAGSS
ncbi:hypothetical protein ASPCAL03674 [Aspergillus calidoustus]|uniref:Uncharacterized protein n=1 Tax=Aspergillus calidoustus TaxID=454130 RepID=A0A0U5C4A6_ASPCI|nr:hypothetical protein ASPCAL03674 [Aspergillus calidoustus]